MEMKKYLALLSLFITIFLLFTILIVGSVLNNSRESILNEQFRTISNEFNNMQTLLLMSEAFDNEMACLAFEAKLKDMDMTIWKLGAKIDKYRSATEEFHKDDYYISQKEIFNENQLSYYLMMKQMIEKCNISKSIILFFYQNSVDCKKCDDQSFILSDINDLDDVKGDQEIAIFSFDMDLNITTLDLMHKYYKIDQYPCVIIDDEKHCGIQDKNYIMREICKKNPEIVACKIYEYENQ